MSFAVALSFAKAGIAIIPVRVFSRGGSVEEAPAHKGMATACEH
jgi:hypothetical protein